MLAPRPVREVVQTDPPRTTVTWKFPAHACHEEQAPGKYPGFVKAIEELLATASKLTLQPTMIVPTRARVRSGAAVG